MVGTENLRRIIDQICRDKGIDRALLIDAIEEAVRSAVKKKYGGQRDIEVQYSEELGEIEVFQYRTVVEEVLNEEREISLEDARLRDPEAGLDDDIGEKLTTIADLGRIAAQSAKQVIIHRMREAEREVIYDMYRDREGTVVNGIVQRFERGDMIVNLGRTDALLPRDGQIPKRSFKQGDRIRAYLEQVRRASRDGNGDEGQPQGKEGKPRYRDAQLILNRTSNEFLAKLFELEVPEIAEGIVKIMGVSRDPGFRAKIAVSSLESDVDPVGACVGLKGSRVQNVVQELQGERIDIVPWSPDPAKYVCNALAPAQVNMVVVDEERKALLVVVPDDQLSLAIGRQGQNVRLAYRLLGWRIDVKSQQRYNNLEHPGYRSLLAVQGIDENLADKLFAAGILTAAMLARLDSKKLAELARIDEDVAELVLARAAEVESPELTEEELAAAGAAPGIPAQDQQHGVAVQDGVADAAEGDAF
ncbi:MAG: transcription termination factor NusA [Desulfobulbaceae bacterium]|nr:transcription termination factor NusA [Desulfobulbaceae bacterium]